MTTWILAGLLAALAGYSWTLRRRIRGLRMAVRQLERSVSSARSTRQVTKDSYERLQRTLDRAMAAFDALQAERDQLRQLLTDRAGHVFDLSTDMAAADADADTYHRRMAAYDEELRQR